MQEQTAQALRVKEQAEQTLRVSTAFTEAEVTGRSADEELNREEPMTFQAPAAKVGVDTEQAET